MGIDLSFIQEFYRKVNSKLVKKIPKISSLDYNFFFLPTNGYQEVFKLREDNQRKKIVAFDYNSMYATAMKGCFPDPANLIYVKENKWVKDTDTILEGMYHVILYEPDKFIQNYSALRYVWMLKSFPIALERNSPVETLITGDELKYYSRHFQKIFVVEKIVSKNVISHPLVNNVTSLFNKRLHYKLNNNSEYSKLYKFYLTILHSVSNSREKLSKYFLSGTDLVSFLEKSFCITKPQNMRDSCFLLGLGNNQFSVEDTLYGLKLTFPNNFSSHNIFSLYSYIIARARVLMMKTLELMLSIESVEICYCNIDSIHVSVDKDKCSQLFDLLNSNKLLGNRLGQLKIECEAESGYWLCPGKYWLLEDKKIVAHKNICLFHRFLKDDIELFRKFVFLEKNSRCLLTQKVFLTIDKTYSMRKKTDGNYFYRISSNEIENGMESYYLNIKKTNFLRRHNSL